MNFIFFAVIIISLILSSLCQDCPPIYLRYSKEHTYCKPKNLTCEIYHSGVTDAEKQQILNLHNNYRSSVATGKESAAGGMPEAADMMEMVWDAELASVAQKLVETCVYAHDCGDCRRVENFSVGQNIAYRERSCTACGLDLSTTSDWTEVMKAFYDEIQIFDKSYINSMVFTTGKVYGHFTQIVWSKTWRVGCGFAAYKIENGYRHFYACNYGPSGNMVNNPMYKIGTPCTSCPINTCCGETCEKPFYEGLCRMNQTEVPIYRSDENYIFYCDFNSLEGDCSTSVEGPDKWKVVKALGGYYEEVVLNGGETSTLKFTSPIKPTENFCLITKYRAGPTINGQTALSDAKLNYQIGSSLPLSMKVPKGPEGDFFTYTINTNWKFDTTVSFTFSVPNEAPPQFFDIQLVAAKSGKCSQ